MVLFSKDKTPKYLVYKERLTLYEVLFSCKIKDHVNHIWLDGLVYRDKETGQVYTRAIDSFEKDKHKWEVYYS